MTLQDRLMGVWNFFVFLFAQAVSWLGREFPVIADIADFVLVFILLFFGWVFRKLCLRLAASTSGTARGIFLFFAYTIGLPGIVAGVLWSLVQSIILNSIMNSHKNYGRDIRNSPMAAANAPTLRPDGYDLYEALVKMRRGADATVRVYASDPQMATELIEVEHGLGSILGVPMLVGSSMNSNMNYGQNIANSGMKGAHAPTLRPDGYDMYEAWVRMRHGADARVRVYASDPLMATELIEGEHGEGSIIGAATQVR